jgi:NADH-quinone oxidoreductase subunit G
MPTIYIENKPYEVEPGENLLRTCLSLGFDLPYFCWHPAMHSVGACRQCAIKQFRDEHDTKGSIVMACMTPVQDGMRLSIDDPEARRFRTGVIEWLMTNHPHDCPVCDEGGECHLQDMTVMTGHAYRRFRGRKRTYRSQDLGPFLTHEMNRCIACYRCVRFYNDYAGGDDFGAFASRNHVFFGRASDGAPESPFAGNLVEVCPTGVFTDKTFAAHYTRPWDLRTAPSVCVHCSLGCNTIPGERYGTLRRIRNRYNGEVNGYFLCDRGRYGYEFVNSDRRVREPRVRSTGEAGLEPAGGDDAIRRLSEMVASARRVIGIGSPRASLEANFALRALVGPDRFYAGVSGSEQRLTDLAMDIMKRSPALIPSLGEVAACDAVLVLGEDLGNTAPMLHLQVLRSLRRKQVETAAGAGIGYWDDTAVRVAAGRESSPLFVITTGATGLDPHATAFFRPSPPDIGRIGFAIAHEIDGAAPQVCGLPEGAAPLAAAIASALKQARRPLIVSGLSCRSEAVLKAAANIAWALAGTGRNASLCLVMPECNSVGLGLLSAPGLDAALEDAQAGADVAIVLENDLYRHLEIDQADRFFRALRHLVVIDHLFHRTALKADMVLPAATFAEETGTLVNNEGRAQRYFQVFPAGATVRPGWQWLQGVMSLQGHREAGTWHSLDALIISMARAIPLLGRVAEAAPQAAFRVAGMKIAREHQRCSGRTAVNAAATVHEPPPPQDADAPFTFSMEGYVGRPPSALIPRFWAPGWNSVQSVNKFQAAVGGRMIGGDPGVRLIDSTQRLGARYFDEIPEPFSAEPGLFLVVPFYHVFGSGELSMLSPGIRERAPAAYLAMSAADMGEAQLEENDAAVLSIGGRIYVLPVRTASGLPSGIAAVPCGVPGAPVLTIPAFGQVVKAAP